MGPRPNYWSSKSCEMLQYIQENGRVYQERPEFLTVRGKMNGVDSDFVLCRKDGIYSDGRRPDSVVPGTIFDDLARRDFTMNAIAWDVQNKRYVDPHDGMNDIRLHLIRCVGNPMDRINEDPLRLIRAARFSITKGFHIYPDIARMFDDKEIVERMMNTVSEERIREELNKMFSYDTCETMKFFSRYPLVMRSVFSKSIWLKPTSEKSREMTRSELRWMNEV